MDIKQKSELIILNKEFYEKTADSFSASRQSFWPGWSKLPLPNEDDKILDIASGNMRFEKFLRNKIDDFQYLGVDSCKALQEKSHLITEFFITIDILGQMLKNQDWTEKLKYQKWDYIFCCAFLHHIPGEDWRLIFLKKLASLLAKNGKLVVNFWQFGEEPKMRKKVITDLGENDYILGWEAGVQAQRFCHSFSKNEIEEIKKEMSKEDLSLINEYKADGANQKMNHYLIWQKKSVNYEKVVSN